jgi:hypothetical protein
MRSVCITRLTDPQPRTKRDSWWVVEIVSGPFKTKTGAERWVDQHKLDFRVSGQSQKTAPAESGNQRANEP